MNNTESGFIALISVVIIGAVLMAVTFSLSVSGFFARANIADSEYKEQSATAAQACIQDALLRRAIDPTYTGNETVVVGSDQCAILSIPPSGANIVVDATSTVQGATTNYRVTADAGTPTILTWQELANF